MTDICTNCSLIVNTSIDMMFHSALLFLIIGLFFMLYASKIIKDVFASELDHMVKTDFKKVLDGLDPASKVALKTSIKTVDMDKLIKLYSTEDKAFTVHNEWLFNVIIIITVSLFLVTIVAMIVSKLLCNDIHLTHLVVENFIVFAGIGLIEMMFFFFVAKKYIPSPPSKMVDSIIESLNKNL